MSKAKSTGAEICVGSGHPLPARKNSLLTNMHQRPVLYLMAIPVIAYYVIFHYIPMLGIVMGFQDYLPAHGFIHSKWVGLDQFRRFFNSINAGRLIRNTFLISFYDLLFGFPVPIIFALLLNEVKGTKFKKVTQTITYMPHFVSLVVVGSLIFTLCRTNGPISTLVASLNGTDPTNLLAHSEYFRTIYVGSSIWQSFGWNSILYFAALSGVDPALYEASYLDGAGRFKQAWHITLPSIAPTIIIMLILRIGSLMSVGHEKIILLYSPITYETADVISSYVYRVGLMEMNYSYGTAVGLFNSVINLVLVMAVNWVSNKVTETSLW